MQPHEPLLVPRTKWRLTPTCMSSPGSTFQAQVAQEETTLCSTKPFPSNTKESVKADETNVRCRWRVYGKGEGANRARTPDFDSTISCTVGQRSVTISRLKRTCALRRERALRRKQKRLWGSHALEQTCPCDGLRPAGHPGWL